VKRFWRRADLHPQGVPGREPMSVPRGTFCDIHAPSVEISLKIKRNDLK
jgi:hypothetical protein